jgi:8-hydroxy-5-deazaflavin:NADPH oxidoreductase
MNIVIIGTGNVGRALGARWAQNGHSVIYGSRDPQGDKVQKLLGQGADNIRAATIAEAAAAGEVVLLAVPWPAAHAAITEAGNLAGKILIDAVNPLAGGGLAVDCTTSAGEQIAGWATGARVVKAFNSTGAGNMTNPDYAGQQPTMFICGDDAQAKTVVAGLAKEIGFDVTDSGGLSMSRSLEALALLWVTLVYSQGLGPNIAFKLLRR